MTDANGAFTFDVLDQGGHYEIWASRTDANHHRIATTGTVSRRPGTTDVTLIEPDGAGTFVAKLVGWQAPIKVALRAATSGPVDEWTIEVARELELPKVPCGNYELQLTAVNQTDDDALRDDGRRHGGSRRATSAAELASGESFSTTTLESSARDAISNVMAKKVDWYYHRKG